MYCIPRGENLNEYGLIYNFYFWEITVLITVEGTAIVVPFT